MKCRICGSRLELKEYRKRICKSCIEKMPRFLRDKGHTLEDADLKKILSKIHTQEDFSDPAQYEIWFKYGSIGITATGIVIDRKHIVLFKDLNNFYFDFLPRKRTSRENECCGEYCLNFEIKGIPYEFRTSASNCAAVFRIKNGQLYPNFPERLIDLANYIRKGVLDKAHNLSEEKKEYEKEYSSGFYRERSRVFRNTDNKSHNTDNKSRNTGYKSQNTEKNEKGHGNAGSGQKKTGSDLENALQMFNLTCPYSNDDLKKVYRALIRQCHPDQQVKTSNLKAEDVNRYYGVLKRYAS